VQEVKLLLRYLSVQGLLFPWIDFVAGKCMLLGQTRAIMASKIISVALSIGLLILFVYTLPYLNGGLAGLVTAIAAPLELGAVYLWLRRSEKTVPIPILL
jgi:Na+-driven multidrug efflux pump